MYNDYKVVVNTAAGRRRYMQYLLPQVLVSKIIDRYDIWVNTNDILDIEFFKQLSEKYPIINLVWQPDQIVNGIASINAFYKECIEEKTIYIKLDDDIIWLEPNFFEKMIRFRIENPTYFVVSPLVINNSHSTYILQATGKLPLFEYYRSDASHPILWKSGIFAFQLHKWFIDKYLKTNMFTQLYSGKHPIALTRFSINAIVWFGEEMKKFGGMVPGDDEEFLSCIRSTELGISNCFNGDCIISHFAFYAQREYLDKAEILENYGAFLREEWEKNQEIHSIYNVVHSIYDFVENNKITLLQKKSPYKQIKLKTSLRSRIAKRLPHLLMDVILFMKQQETNKMYIKQ